MTFKEALSKLKLNQPPPIGQENYHYLISVREEENMCTFKDLLLWYNNNDFVPKLEATQNMVTFFINKGTDNLRFGCISPKPANLSLHQSTSARFQPLTESYKDLIAKIRQDVVGGLLIVFTSYCDIKVPENLRENFANFPPLFRTIIVPRDDNCPLIQMNAENEEFLTQPRRMLLSCHFLEQSLQSCCCFFGSGAGLQKHLPFWALHSYEEFRQLCSVCSEG